MRELLIIKTAVEQVTSALLLSLNSQKPKDEKIVVAASHVDYFVKSLNAILSMRQVGSILDENDAKDIKLLCLSSYNKAIWGNSKELKSEDKSERSYNLSNMLERMILTRYKMGLIRVIAKEAHDYNRSQVWLVSHSDKNMTEIPTQSTIDETIVKIKSYVSANPYGLISLSC